jgi:hypothetical protein
MSDQMHPQVFLEHFARLNMMAEMTGKKSPQVKLLLRENKRMYIQYLKSFSLQPSKKNVPDK